MPLLGANREWGGWEVKESDYILATNIARIRAAIGILRDVYLPTNRDSDALMEALRKLREIEDRLDEKVTKGGRA